MVRLRASTDYAELKREVRAAGCYAYAPWRSVVSLALHLACAVALFWVSARVHAWAAVPLFVFASFVFYRLGWLMHDSAHGGTFRSRRANRVFAALTAGILGEFVSGWRHGHDRHHAAPNVRGVDGDQSERWDAERRFAHFWSAAPNLLLLSRFRGKYLPKSLLLLGLRDGFYCHRYHRERFVRELCLVVCGFGLQLAGLVLLFGPWGVPLFLAHTSIGMLYLNTVFAGNHYDLESFTEAEASTLTFAELQIRTCRNYTGDAWARFVFGGLENQIEHHLFPDLPRHQLRRAAPLVRAFCERRGLPYVQEPFSSALAKVIRFHVDAPAPEVASP